MLSSKWIWLGAIGLMSTAGCLAVLGIEGDYETVGEGGNSTTTSPTGGAAGSTTTSASGGTAGNGGAMTGGAGGGGSGGSVSGGSAGSGGVGGSGGTGGGGPCTAPEDCPTGNECLLPTCDVMTGQCGSTPAPDGTPLATQTTGDCKVTVCDSSGGTVTINDDQDIFNDGKDCTIDACSNGAPGVQAAAPGASCDDGGGKLCDGAGECVQCLMDADCVNPMLPKCSAGVCVSAQCNDGTKNGTETDVDCGGSCPPCATGDDCGVAADCQSGVCNGTCQAPVCNDGVKNGTETAVDCGGGACPKCGPGADCNTNSDCAGNQCTGMGGTCVANCQDGVKNNAETDVDCGGGTCQGCNQNQACGQDLDCQGAFYCNAAGACTPKTVDGTACMAANQCQSGFCADGACCNVACGGLCQACNIPGSVGSCSQLPAGQDPANECAGTLVCNGLGQCKKPVGDTCAGASDCATNLCADGVCCDAPCNGVCQACNLMGSVGTCTNIPAGQDPANECPTDCNGTGACGSLKGPGQACMMGNECQSGNCVDGVCCNTLCATSCVACNLAGSLGTCTPIPAGTDPAAECPGTDICDGFGACKKANSSTCVIGTDCLSGNCIDGVCCNTTCTGTCQACNVAGSIGTCANVPNNADPANECANGACNGAGLCKLDNGQTCAAGSACLSGNCIDGVCCNTTCTATCQACNVAGSVGTCANVPNNADPANECANGACNGSGVCKLDNGQTCAAGSACLSGNCIDTVCCNTTCSGSCQACNLSGTAGTCSNIPSGQDPASECASGSCNGSGVCKLDLGIACAANGDCLSGNCIDGVCCNTTCAATCMACNVSGSAGTCTNVPSGTDPSNECTGNAGADVCNGSGVCKEVNGTTCAAGAECLSANCIDGVCCNTTCTGTCVACNVSGSLGTCANIPNGQDPGNECAGAVNCSGMGTCGALLSDGSACMVGNECQSGNCIDGVCCNTTCTGTCQACNISGSLGVCSSIASGTDPANECTGNSGADVCNGAGACKAVNSSSCAANGDCLSGNCIDGVCCNTTCTGTCQACNVAGSVGTCSNIANGQDPANECASGSCNGSGVCKLDNGQTCAAGSACLSGNCIDGVCCNSACSGTCQACNVAGSVGTCSNIGSGQDPANECTNGSCNGSGVCKLDNGQTCMASSDCLSGSCVDGVCCNTACTGTCQACNIAGSIGTCSNIANGQDPANECASGACNGSGVCKLDNGQTCAAGSACLSGNCADSVCCNSACSGTCQACNISGSVGTCSNVPSGTDPANECTNGSCNGSAVCKLDNGQTCVANGDCLSGNCIDGVCCNTTCTGTCQACNVAGSVGTCSNIGSGQDPANECMGGSCNGSGVCKLDNGQTCAAGSACLSGNCIDGVCCNSACSGTCQACNVSGSVGTCSNVPSGTDPANECASGSCNGSGVCKLDNGQTCMASSDCLSGSCVDGVCCNTTCTGTCKACTAAKTGGVNGTCANILSGTDPDAECAGASVCNGAGACQVCSPGSLQSCQYSYNGMICPGICFASGMEASALPEDTGCDPSVMSCLLEDSAIICNGEQYCLLDGSGWDTCSSCPMPP